MGLALRVEPRQKPPPSPEQRLWQAVIQHSVETLARPEQQCRRMGIPPARAEWIRMKEIFYVLSPLFEQHCAWAGFDPFRIRTALARAKLLDPR